MSSKPDLSLYMVHDPLKVPFEGNIGAGDRLAKHCAVLDCLKAIAPPPAETMTWPELLGSPASRTRWSDKEPAPPVCLRVSKQPSEGLFGCRNWP